MTDQSPDCSSGALAWLESLIACPTVSGSHSNLELLALAESFLRKIGFAVRYTYSEDRKRANLYASLGGSVGGILLSGHTDVVPVAGQDWTRDPFRLTDEGERLYGRGACDMKGFLACVLATVGRLGSGRLAQPVHIALTYDEEIGCVGVRGLLADLRQHGIRPSACIVGEPTRMEVVRAHKGRHAWRCNIRGRAEHSSLSGMGVNAAETACALAAEVAAQAQALQSATRDEGFYVPFSTMAVCRVHSGHASNVIPEEAEFDFDLRFLPGVEPDAVLAPIHQRARELERTMRQRVSESQVLLMQRTSVPALVPRADTDMLVEALFRAGAQAGGHVAYTTEGGLYQQAGIPALVCGPGDISQAHTADEYILRSQLGMCESVLERLLAGGP
ncbi:acetylornithine deacetylase [Achromobacter anxifer]